MYEAKPIATSRSATARRATSPRPWSRRATTPPPTSSSPRSRARSARSPTRGLLAEAAAGHPRPGAAAVPRPGRTLGRRHRPRPGDRLRAGRRSASELPDSPLGSPTRRGRAASAGRPPRDSLQQYVTALRLRYGDDVAREWLEGMVDQRRPGVPRQRLDPRRDRQRRDRRRPDQPLLRRPGRRRRGARLPGEGLLPAEGARLAAAPDQRRRARVVRPQGRGVRLHPHACSPNKGQDVLHVELEGVPARQGRRRRIRR